MTENEARQKWCPEPTCGRPVRFDWDDARAPQHITKAKCVASDCMMFRWLNSKHGYCGLAGKP